MAYAKSDAIVNVLIGNMGEGKTYASVAAMICHAKRCKRPIRAAIVRDTHENIKTSTAVSIREMFDDAPEMIRFADDYKKLTIFSEPPVDVRLFGIADLGALSKLQGPEYALIWLEEPAPMSDRCNAGLSVEVYRAALVRCARQKGTKARLQISMNPADEDHWTYTELIDSPEILPEYPLVSKQVFYMQYGENKHLSAVARQAVQAAYKDDPAAYTRYVEGKFASVYRGKKVTPEFNPLLHVAPAPLEPARGLVSFRYYDSWHNPTCGLGQITTTGRLIFLDTCKLEGSDIRTLIETQVEPLLNSPRWKDKAKAWRDIGDFSMRQPDQSNRQESAAKVVEGAFRTVFEPGPPKWEIMKLGLKRGLNQIIMGMPAVVVCPNNKLLIKGLSGAWHYKTDNAGNITSTIPEKDEISHVCDGWANAVNVLLPTRGAALNPAAYKKLAQQAKARIESYGVQGGRP